MTHSKASNWTAFFCACLNAVEKVLKGGNRVYIAGLGNIEDTDVSKNLEYVFPGKGKIRSNGRSLSFVAISNENGLCYDAYGGFTEKPCPSEPFPLWNKTRAHPRGTGNIVAQ